jgi:hypothetical protein
MTPEQFLARYKIECFYHLTDVRNLDSISIRQTGGLLRLSELRRRRIEVLGPGGNDWSHDADIRLGLDQFVHLCLFPEHPMEYRAKEDGRVVESRFLQINPVVLKCEGIRFAPDVSNKKGVQLLTLAEACAAMDFMVIYERTDWRDPQIQECRKQARKSSNGYPTNDDYGVLTWRRDQYSFLDLMEPAWLKKCQSNLLGIPASPLFKRSKTLGSCIRQLNERAC